MAGARAPKIDTLVRGLRASVREHRVRYGSVSTVPALFGTAIRGISQWIWSAQEIRYYRETTPTGTRSAANTPLRRHALDDLLRYQPVTSSDRPRRIFLRDALAHLEQGAVPLTWVANGALRYCGWIESDARLRDDVVHPIARAEGLDAAIAHAGFEYAGSRWIETRFGRGRERTTWNSESQS